MKKCAYCGQEYPDQMTTCPQDGNPLPVPPPAAPPPLPVPSSGLARTSLILGCALVFIALLAGLLLPALARAKYKAEQINCVNRLMSIDLAYAALLFEVQFRFLDNHDGFAFAEGWLPALAFARGRCRKQSTVWSLTSPVACMKA